jgi:hypothetical protein
MLPQQRKNLINETCSSMLSSVSSESTVQKRFHFSLTSNEIHHVPHIVDFSDREVCATWYAKADYEKITMSMIPLIRKMMKGETVDETNSQTIRGLEYRTRQGAIRRQRNKVEAITAVLGEQDRQSFHGKFDDELLSQVYSLVNAHCQEEAYQLARRDVQPAQEKTADARETTKKIVYQQRQNERERSRRSPLRQMSFSELMKQMRSLTQPAATVARREEAVQSTVAGSAA